MTDSKPGAPGTPDLRARACVVLPTYNERENISAIVPAILAASPELDLLIVDDGSPDGTGQIADELAAQDSRIRVLHRTRKEGLGRAYLAGFAQVLAKGYGRILQMDADFSHAPDRLPVLLAGSRDADLVVGSRYVEGGGTVNWGLGRRVLSKGGSFYARNILGLKIRDLTGGFRCFRREVLEKLDLETVHSNGYAFQIEMAYRTVRRGFSVVEVPITFVDRRVGKSKMSRRIVAEALWMVWKIRFDKSASGR